MSLNRNAIFDALFALGTSSSVFALTSRRLQYWNSDVAQPALFLRALKDTYPARDPQRPVTKVMLHAEFWIYYYTADKDEAPGIMLDQLVSNLEDALRPTIMNQAQTLGGLVQHCWIEGDIEKDDGALTGQSIARVPIQILAIS